MKYVDLTHMLTNRMPVFPGDEAMQLEPLCTVENDGIANHKISCSMHTGTHIDAPGHFIAQGKKISDFPVGKFIGKAFCIDVRGMEKIEKHHVQGKLGLYDIVLFYTGWDRYFYEPNYFDNYPVITKSCAQYLVEQGVSMVGVDTPSVDKAPYAIHKTLLSYDILIIENLTNLHLVYGKENIEIIALPLKVEADGALARVIAF